MNDIPMFWVILVCAIVAVLIARRVGRNRIGKTSGLGVDVEGDLLRACRGDRAMVERLTQHELDRRPDLSTTGAALLALSRLRDDKR